MQRTQTHLLVTFVFASLCFTDCVVPGHSSTSIVGHIANEAGLPVAAAPVSITGGASTTTNTAGDFSVTPSVAADQVVLTVQMPGYGRLIRRVEANKPLLLTLRPTDVQTTVQLPTVGQPPVSVQVTRADGSTTLAIPPNALVDPQGNIVSGTVQVSITYWHPLLDLLSAPGALFAAPQGSPLETFGMADIEVTQANQLLQVASGQSLTWQVTLPSVLANSIASRAPAAQPNLYSLDTNTGFWKLEGTLATGLLAYNATAGQFTAQLPHLSDWNVDGALIQNGGCVQGRVISQCTGLPIANANATLWYLGVENTIAYALKTDASGNYCSTTGTRSADTRPQYVHYYLSGSTATDSNMCNPLPVSCETCDAASLSDGYCNACQYRNTESCLPGQGFGAAEANPVITAANCSTTCNNQSDAAAIQVCNDLYMDTCNSPLIAFETCHFCPGDLPADGQCSLLDPDSAPQTAQTGCVQLQDLVVSDGCESSACRSPNAKREGDACTANSDCCPNSSLVCLDYLCVPR